MHRRTFLASTVGGLASTAGCLSGDAGTPGEATTSTPLETTANDETTAPGTTEAAIGPMHGDNLPTDDDPSDGYPPEFEQVPDERAIDTDSYDQQDSGVVLAPIEDVYYWYARREARFVDARSAHAFGKSQIFGAVSSPVNQAGNGDFDDPVADFPKDDRVIAYCGCPHHLSSMRAERMMNNGYENVFVIDEGFWEWHDRSYPMAGDDTDRAPNAIVLRGRSDPASAGRTAWARHPPTDQVEATDIREDGSYEMTLRFHGVSGRSPVEVETPDYRVERPLSELASGMITGPQ